MATFTGLPFPTQVSLSTGRVSTNLDNATGEFRTAHAEALLDLPAFGVASPFRGDPDVVPRLGVAQPGIPSSMTGPGRDWFERFFVIFDGAAFGRLSIRDLGSLLSNQLAQFEIWNTDRRQAHVLLSLTPAGPTGVNWIDSFGVPLQFLPLQSRIYEVEIRLAGSPQIDNFLIVEFDGLPGPDPTVQGQRVIPIPFFPEWTDGIEEGPVYRTDIFLSDDGSEQRVRRRFTPRHRVRYDVIPGTDRELQLLDQLLWGWSRFAYGIPLWPDAVRSMSTLSPGQTVIPLETALRRFVPGGVVLIVAGSFEWEAGTVASVDANQITLEDELQQSWGAYRTFVVPLCFGRLEQAMPVERPTGRLAAFTVDAICESLG